MSKHGLIKDKDLSNNELKSILEESLKKIGNKI